MSWTRRDADGHAGVMQLLDELRREHELIERLVLSLRAFAAHLTAGTAPVDDGFAILDCLASYVGGWHHEREEDVLFDALAKTLPSDRGPIAVMLSDHGALGESLSAMRTALTADDPDAFMRLAFDYSRALWAHIDAENSVLFPESEIRLRRSGIGELASDEAPAEIIGVVERANALIARYPGGDSSDVIRGEGCVMCPAYGDACSGLEREWWNEWEWEELDEHVAGA